MPLNRELLDKHIKTWLHKQKENPDRPLKDPTQRRDLVEYYRSWTADRMSRMAADDLHDYMSRLWAMLIWGNERYALDKMIGENWRQICRAKLS